MRLAAAMEYGKKLPDPTAKPGSSGSAGGARGALDTRRAAGPERAVVFYATPGGRLGTLETPRRAQAPVLGLTRHDARIQHDRPQPKPR